MRRQHNDIVKEIRTEAETTENHNTVERDNAFSHYPRVMRSISGIIKVDDERNAGHTHVLPQLHLFF